MREQLDASHGAALEHLASSLDRANGAGEDWGDEDNRARLYHLAAASADAHGRLRIALRQESNKLLVAEVLIGALESAPAEEHADWLKLVPPSSPRYEYAARRAEEAALLQAMTAPAAEAPGAPALESWSDWLQRRIAERAVSAALLTDLAVAGRTRRVRNAARSRLREVSAGG